MADRISLAIEAAQRRSDRGREDCNREAKLPVRVAEPHDVPGGAQR